MPETTTVKAPPKNSAAFEVVEIAERKGDFFHHDGIAYVSVILNGQRETFEVHSTRYAQVLRLAYRAETTKIVGDAIRSAVDTLAARACLKCPARPVFTRVANVEDKAIYLDLGPGKDVVEVTGGGWRIIPSLDAPVRFLRSPEMLPLPVPVRDGKIGELRPFFNTGSEDDFNLGVSWLEAALRGVPPFPILFLHGVAVRLRRRRRGCFATAWTQPVPKARPGCGMTGTTRSRCRVPT
jgi:hypothetical protein